MRMLEQAKKVKSVKEKEVYIYLIPLCVCMYVWYGMVCMYVCMVCMYSDVFLFSTASFYLLYGATNFSSSQTGQTGHNLSHKERERYTVLRGLQLGLSLNIHIYVCVCACVCTLQRSGGGSP